jgi:clan AA aspartic protease
MGLGDVRVLISNPRNRAASVELAFHVDSGAIYSVVPREILAKLGVEPEGVETLYLADLTPIVRQAGELAFSYGGKTRVSPVMFGDEGDVTLLGVLTLESLGLILDPVKQQLRPMEMRNAQ